MKSIQELEKEIEVLKKRESLVDKAYHENWIHTEKGHEAERKWLVTCLDLDKATEKLQVLKEVLELINKLNKEIDEKEGDEDAGHWTGRIDFIEELKQRITEGKRT